MYKQQITIYRVDRKYLFFFIIFDEVYGQSSNGNIGSKKVIEKNNGILLEECEGTHYFKIKL